eukprot:c41699_g1_i1 orf=3-185(-)
MQIEYFRLVLCTSTYKNNGRTILFEHITQTKLDSFTCTMHYNLVSKKCHFCSLLPHYTILT